MNKSNKKAKNKRIKTICTIAMAMSLVTPTYVRADKGFIVENRSTEYKDSDEKLVYEDIVSLLNTAQRQASLNANGQLSDIFANRVPEVELSEQQVEKQDTNDTNPTELGDIPTNVNSDIDEKMVKEMKAHGFTIQDGNYPDNIWRWEPVVSDILSQSSTYFKNYKGKDCRLSPNIILAIIQTETSGSPYIIGFDPNGKTTGFGLVQYTYHLRSSNEGSPAVPTVDGFFKFFTEDYTKVYGGKFEKDKKSFDLTTYNQAINQKAEHTFEEKDFFPAWRGYHSSDWRDQAVHWSVGKKMSIKSIENLEKEYKDIESKYRSVSQSDTNALGEFSYELGQYTQNPYLTLIWNIYNLQKDVADPSITNQDELLERVVLSHNVGMGGQSGYSIGPSTHYIDKVLGEYYRPYSKPYDKKFDPQALTESGR